MMRRPIGVVALVVLSGALLLLAIAVAPSEANVPGRNGLIVFQRLVGTPSKTCHPAPGFTINADGSGLHQITSGPPIAANPAWTPDAKRVVMEHGKGLGLLDIRTGRLRQITNRANLWPSFSPDGKLIVFWTSTTAHGESLWDRRRKRASPTLCRAQRGRRQPRLFAQGIADSDGPKGRTVRGRP